MRWAHRPSRYFASIVAQDIAAHHAAWFKRTLGPAHAIARAEDPELLEARSTDWTRRWAPLPPGDGSGSGASMLLLKPSSTAEVAACVRYCHDHRIPLVPQGGYTGLVGRF